MMLSLVKRAGQTLLCTWFLLSWTWADSLTLRDGRHLEGKYIGGSSTLIGFVTNGAVQYYPITNVLAVVFGDPGVDSPLGTIQQNSYHNHSAQASHGTRASGTKAKAKMKRRVQVRRAPSRVLPGTRPVLRGASSRADLLLSSHGAAPKCDLPSNCRFRTKAMIRFSQQAWRRTSCESSD